MQRRAGAPRVLPRRCCAVTVACALAAACFPGGCKRDAEAPLPQAVLFPKAGTPNDSGAKALFGALARAVEIAEREPNDSREISQSLGVGHVVKATIGPPHEVAKTGDWYQLGEAPSIGHSTRLELFNAPSCARLELFDDAGQRLQTAGVSRGRAVLDHLRGVGDALFARVSCRPARRGKQSRKGGPYRLQLTARPRLALEESEPNDTTSDPSTLKTGEQALGTLSFARDVDRWQLVLDHSAAPQALSVTGLPGVRLQLRIVAANGTTLLRRQSSKGAALLIPNLAPRLVGTDAQVIIGAHSGAAPDHSYALTIQQVAEEWGKHIDEREPNDRRSAASILPLDAPRKGTLDNPLDTDWYALDVAPGSALEVTLHCPTGLRTRLVAHPGDGNPVWRTTTTDGAKLQIKRVVARSERFFVRVEALKGTQPTTAAYRLEVTNLSALDEALDLSGLATPDSSLAPAHSATMATQAPGEAPAAWP